MRRHLDGNRRKEIRGGGIVYSGKDEERKKNSREQNPLVAHLMAINKKRLRATYCNVSVAQETLRRQNLAPCLDFRSHPCCGSSPIILFLPRINLSPSFSLLVICFNTTRGPDIYEACQHPAKITDAMLWLLARGRNTHCPIARELGNSFV